MKDEDLTPLDSDVAALLRAERDIPEPKPETKARMLATISTRIGVPPGGGGGGGGNGGGGGVRAPSFVLSGWQTPVAIAAAFLLGFATHAMWPPSPSAAVAPPAAGENALRSADVASAPAPRAAPANIPSLVPSALPNAPPASSSSFAASAVAWSAASAEREPDNRGLAGERALLDVARTALANGDSASALAAVARHERTYPSGLLVEEREAIAIKALVASGRYDEARARGSRFAKRFPSGLMRPAVDGALRSINEPP
jgi:hypothetical protein